MALSLRVRLTAWYSVLLVLTLAVFSGTVLWLHWRLLLEQFDESLKSISATANNVVAEELAELKDLGLAATDMAAVVRPTDYVVQVLDASGSPIHQNAQSLPLPSDVHAPGFKEGIRTLSGADGRPWRVSVRPGSADGRRYLVAVGAPLDEVMEEWRTLLTAPAAADGEHEDNRNPNQAGPRGGLAAELAPHTSRGRRFGASSATASAGICRSILVR